MNNYVIIIHVLSLTLKTTEINIERRHQYILYLHNYVLLHAASFEKSQNVTKVTFYTNTKKKQKNKNCKN